MEGRKRISCIALPLGFLYLSVLCYTNFRNRRVVEQKKTTFSVFKAGNKHQNRQWKLSGRDTILNTSLAEKQITKKRKNLSDSSTNRTVAFIHVGKSGGSSITKILRNSCHNYRKACVQQAAERYIPNETSLSLLTKAYYHTTDKTIPFEQYTSFIVVIRNPLDRIISAFAWDHPKNMHHPVRKMRRRRGTTYDCFSSLEEFAMALADNVTSGLKSVTLDNGKIHLNCTQVARDAILGKDDNFRHMYFNYKWYLGAAPKNKELFVIRNGYLWDDSRKINNLLGGDGDFTFTAMGTGGYHLLDRKKMNIPVPMSLSSKGRSFLCLFLKNEFNLYFHILERGMNLDKDDVSETIKEAKKSCDDIFSL